MSDHLFRIAARATGRLTSLHPRPATRFESWRQPLPGGSPGEMSDEGVGEPQGAGRSAVFQTAEARVERQAVPSWLRRRKRPNGDEVGRVEASGELGSKAKPAPSLTQTSTQASRRQLPDAVRIVEPDLPRPGPKGSPRGALPEARYGLAGAEPAGPGSQFSAASNASRSPLAGGEDRRTVAVGHGPTGERPSSNEWEPVDLRASSVESPEQLTSRRGLMPLVAPSPPRREAAAPERPVVKVTIGRIEVRAVPPAAQARTTPLRTRKTMSLDEYLQQRGRGDR